MQGEIAQHFHHLGFELRLLFAPGDGADIRLDPLVSGSEALFHESPLWRR